MSRKKLSDVLPSHFLFVFSHFSSANEVLSPSVHPSLLLPTFHPYLPPFSLSPLTFNQPLLSFLPVFPPPLVFSSLFILPSFYLFIFSSSPCQLHAFSFLNPSFHPLTLFSPNFLFASTLLFSFLLVLFHTPPLIPFSQSYISSSHFTSSTFSVNFPPSVIDSCSPCLPPFSRCLSSPL